MEIRRSYDRLISTMGFPILVRWYLYTLYYLCGSHFIQYSVLKVMAADALAKSVTIPSADMFQNVLLTLHCYHIPVRILLNFDLNHMRS